MRSEAIANRRAPRLRFRGWARQIIMAFSRLHNCRTVP